MSKVILQPAGNQDAREHYVDTIKNAVAISRISEFVDGDELQNLKNIYSDEAYVWGVTPGNNFVNRTKWKRIDEGDVALFSRDGHIFAAGTVTCKIHNKDLALNLWGTDSAGATWEYIFFLDEIKHLRIPYIEFNRAVGYAENFVIQGFNVLDEDRSSNLFASFDLISDVYLPEISDAEYDKTSIELDELETKVEVKVRKEQGYLRKKLFAGKQVANCAICSREMNIQFLVCAHIKKRSRCSDEEKRNLHNVVPMCKFGCDELFERGYIAVHERKIQVLKDNNTEYVTQYLNNLSEKDCDIYNENNREFFKWHSEFHS